MTADEIAAWAQVAAAVFAMVAVAVTVSITSPTGAGPTGELRKTGPFGQVSVVRPGPPAA